MTGSLLLTLAILEVGSTVYLLTTLAMRNK
jgi:hypothetical protein